MLRLTSSFILVACATVACVPNPDSQQAAGDAGAARPAARPVDTRRALLPSLPRRSLPAVPKRGAPQRPGVVPPLASAADSTAPAHGEAGVAATASSDPPLTGVFYDLFERASPGPDWNVTSPAWRIEQGRLCGQNAHNHGIWLKRTLPVNARIEFDATAASKDGDLKAEIWGDGRSTATGTAYTNATSYLTIFGGWKNRFHVLARINEHAKDRPEITIDPGSADLRAQPVKAGVSYHFKIERDDGKTVHWYVDDIEILDYADKQPLKGKGHDHFGFNDWEVPVCFDNLKITPLEGG